MKVQQQFEQYIRQNSIVEWSPAYINYDYLKKMIQCFKTISVIYKKIIHTNDQEQQILEEQQISYQQKIQINKMGNLLQRFLRLQQRKFDGFVQYKIIENYYEWKLIDQCAKNVQQISIRSHKYNENRHIIKKSIEINYKNIHDIKRFIKINEEILQKIKLVTDRYLRGLYEINRINSFTFRSRNNIQNLIQLVEQIYTKQYNIRYSNQKVKEIIYNTNKIAKSKEYLYLGLFLGLNIFMIFLLVIGLRTTFFQVEQSNTSDSFKNIFPMFRGILIFILYLWGLAWNVYGFTKFNINYKLIFKFDRHYSTYTQIMKRASFFTLLFLILFILYLFGEHLNNTQNANFPVQYTPLIIYLVYFTYIFFPSQNILNPKGRKYFYKTFVNIIFSPIIQMSFIIAWSTDQLVSFVGPLKDLAYTICYYVTDFSVQQISQCSNLRTAQGLSIGYVVAIIPLIYRMIQCAKQALESRQKKFFGHLQMWNFFKYGSSLLTSTISIILKLKIIGVRLYIASSIFSTCYAYYWDLKYDWGFLQKNSKNRFLRDSLSYQNPMVYYFAIIINFFLRCSWTLSISSFNILPADPNILILVTSLLQMIRRCMWNFFRVQKQHIANCLEFRTNEDIKKLLQETKVEVKKKKDVIQQSDVYQRIQNVALIHMNSRTILDMKKDFHSIYLTVYDSNEQTAKKSKSYFEKIKKQESEFIQQQNIEDCINQFYKSIDQRKLIIANYTTKFKTL